MRTLSLSTTICALILLAGVSLSTGHAASYDDRQFEETMQAYLELAREDYAAAAHRLFRLGRELNSAEILRDATYAAISMRDLDLARRVGEVWYSAGGGADSLQVLTRIQISTKGLGNSLSLLKRIAEQIGPAAVYRTLQDSGVEDGKVNAMRVVHPQHLRGSEFHAYTALLLIGSQQGKAAAGEILEGLKKDPNSIHALLVGLYLAEIADNSLTSVNYARMLAEAAATDLATTVMTYESWRTQQARVTTILPQREDFDSDFQFTDRARLSAGLFYLRHDDPGRALELLQAVPRNSASWGAAIAGQVMALKTLDNKEEILVLLAAELENAALEFVPQLAALYAEQLNDVEGPRVAYDFLQGLQRAPDNPDLLYQKAIYAEQVGLLDEAVATLRLVIAANPDSAEGYNALGYTLADHNRNLDEALELVLQALEFQPESPAIIDTHGWVLYRMGDLEGAKRRIEEALQLMGNEPHAEVMAHYGEVLWELGNKQRAVTIWKAAWQLDPEDRYLKATLERYAQQPAE